MTDLRLKSQKKNYPCDARVKSQNNNNIIIAKTDILSILM